MNRFMRTLLLPLLIVALAVPAQAQTAVAKKTEINTSVVARKVTLDRNGVAPPAAFKAVADAIGVKVVVDDAVSQPIDITIRNVTAKTALTAMCESIGCQWTISGDSLSVKPGMAFRVGTYGEFEARREDRVKTAAKAGSALTALKHTLPADMKFDNAPLDVVSKRLSEALGREIKLSCPVPGVAPLTADFGGLTLQEALKVIGETAPRPKGAWRLVVGPQPGDSQTPTIAIMVGPTPAKKK